MMEMQKMMHEMAFNEAKLHEAERAAMERGRLEEMQKIMATEWENEKAKEWANNFAQIEAEKSYASAFDEEKAKLAEEEQGKEAVNGMMQVMMMDPDPKFQNSKFLSFLKKINTGEYEIKEGELVEHPEKAMAEGLYNEAFEEAKEATAMEGKIQMEQSWKEAYEKYFQLLWQHGNEIRGFFVAFFLFNEFFESYRQANMDYNSEEFQKEMERNWKEICENFEDMDPKEIEENLAKQWQAASDMEEMQYVPPGEYEFSKENPALNTEKPMSTSLSLLNIGQTNKAILTIEAHLQKNPGDANAWRLLGCLHQDNDQDQKAVVCFKKSIAIDQNNLDTLLQLGVSCTNTVDEVSAMGYLKDWLMKNPKYSSISVDPTIVYEKPGGEDYTVEEIKTMNAKMIHHFMLALNINGNDPELLSSLAVLHFIQREYERSVDFFGAALKNDPNNYSLHNKLGATLAHLGRTNEAMELYHKALQLKPNYVRVWVNLGIAHAYLVTFSQLLNRLNGSRKSTLRPLASI